MKHSQGEWYACCLNAKPHFVFAGEGEKTVCAICHNDPNQDHYEPMMETVTVEEARANARLIQSAPELLSQLIYVVEVLKIMGCTENDDAIKSSEEIIKKITDESTDIHIRTITR